MTWIVDHWALVTALAGAALAVLKIINRYTPHSSEVRSLWATVLLVVIDLLDLLKRTPAPERRPEIRVGSPRSMARPGGTMLFALLLAIALAPLSACGATWADKVGQGLDTAQVAGEMAWDGAAVAYKAKCHEVARGCKAVPCPEAQECLAEMERWRDAAVTLQRAVERAADILPAVASVVEQWGGER